MWVGLAASFRVGWAGAGAAGDSGSATSPAGPEQAITAASARVPNIVNTYFKVNVIFFSLIP